MRRFEYCSVYFVEKDRVIGVTSNGNIIATGATKPAVFEQVASPVGKWSLPYLYRVGRYIGSSGR